MTEASLEELKKKNVSRRDFLKLIGAGVAAAFVPDSIKWGVEKLVSSKDDIVRLKLAKEIRKGEFRVEKVGKISTLEELRDSIKQTVESLKSLSESQIMIMDGSEKSSIQHGTDSEIFFPASISKIPVCFEAWKKGKDTGEIYLTEEYADQILRRSFTFEEMARKLPIADVGDSSSLEDIVRGILKEAKIPAKNERGNLPLKVNIEDFFKYLVNMEMPEIMKKAMLQTAEDRGENYNVPDVLLDNLPEDTPAYFKLGLVYDESKKAKELVNSYFFQVGDDLKVLGYAKGENKYEVHKQMLYVATMKSSYTKYSRDK